MISNGTYLMILGIFLVLIVIFLLVVFFYLRRTIRCSKPFDRISEPANGNDNDVKRRNGDTEAGGRHRPGSLSSGTLQAKNFENQLEQQVGSSTTTEECNDYLANEHRTATLAKQESLGECSCLNCSLIEMGSSVSYSDGSCPQCGRIPTL